MAPPKPRQNKPKTHLLELMVLMGVSYGVVKSSVPLYITTLMQGTFKILLFFRIIGGGKYRAKRTVFDNGPDAYLNNVHQGASCSQAEEERADGKAI